MNRCQLILKHLKRRKYITSYQAFELYGETRLSARIYDLRQMGYEIDGVWEKHINNFGEETKFIRYFLKKDKK